MRKSHHGQVCSFCQKKCETGLFLSLVYHFRSDRAVNCVVALRRSADRCEARVPRPRCQVHPGLVQVETEEGQNHEEGCRSCLEGVLV